MTGVTTRTDTAGVYTSSDDEGLPAILVNGGDAISIQGTSKNIWIDHCELYNEDPKVQTNHDLYDGLIDIKGQTGFITISWNYLHDHHKAGLVGASDTDLFDDRKVTFHHNYYKNVLLRMPMYRGAVGHFFNNYLVGAQDASEIRAGTCVRVEKNYYEALHYSIYTPSDSPGMTERIDNVEVSRTSRAYPANCTASIPYSYSSALTGTTNDVKTVVPQGAGVGKLP
jgi:pectate lyase